MWAGGPVRANPCETWYDESEGCPGPDPRRRDQGARPPRTVTRCSPGDRSRCRGSAPDGVLRRELTRGLQQPLEFSRLHHAQRRNGPRPRKHSRVQGFGLWIEDREVIGKVPPSRSVGLGHSAASTRDPYRPRATRQAITRTDFWGERVRRRHTQILDNEEPRSIEAERAAPGEQDYYSQLRSGAARRVSSPVFLPPASSVARDAAERSSRGPLHGVHRVLCA